MGAQTEAALSSHGSDSAGTVAPVFLDPALTSSSSYPPPPHLVQALTALSFPGAAPTSPPLGRAAWRPLIL